MSTSFTPTGANSTVVVIDSGWSPAWPTGRLVYQHDFVDNDGDARSADTNTHGAMVTSAILQSAPDVGVIALKVLPDGGGATDSLVVEKALQWVAANAQAYNITAVNLSLASGNTDKPLALEFSDELAALADQRILTVVAGGNAGQGDESQGVSLFAADPNSITVSATTGDGAFPAWAQRSPTQTDIGADGTDILLTDAAGHTFLGNGSSFATPAVTSAIVLAQETARELRGSALTQEEFLTLAKSTGTPVGDTGYVQLDTDALLAELVATYGKTEVAVPGDAGPATPAAPDEDTATLAPGRSHRGVLTLRDFLEGLADGAGKGGLALGHLKALAKEHSDGLAGRIEALPKRLADAVEDTDLPAFLHGLTRAAQKHWHADADAAASDATATGHDLAAMAHAAHHDLAMDATIDPAFWGA